MMNMNSFRWAIIVGPKFETAEVVPGRRFGVVKQTQPPQAWSYQEVELPDLRTDDALLARITIAKIEDEGRFNQILRETAFEKDSTRGSCRKWIAEVLKRLSMDENGAVGTCILDWIRIESLAHKFVLGKEEEGRYTKNEFKGAPAPTWNMLLSREVVQ